MIVKMTALVAGAVLVLASYSVRQARAAAPAQPPANLNPAVTQNRDALIAEARRRGLIQ